MRNICAAFRFLGQYVNAAEEAKSPRVSPLLADDLQDLPPSLFILATHDMRHDEGLAYSQKLGSAGVPVEVKTYSGMIHGFVHLPKAFDPIAQDAHVLIADYITRRANRKFASKL